MTQQSEHGAFVRSQIPLVAQNPVDASIARNVVANNALHGYDMASRVLVHDVAPQGFPFTPVAGGSSLYRLAKMWGPFPARVRADGSITPMIARMLVGGAVGEFKLTLHPYPEPWSPDVTPPDIIETSTRVLYFQTSDSSVEWRAPDKILRFPARDSRVSQIPTFTADGGDRTQVGVVLLQLALTVKSSFSGAVGWGAYLREYVG